MRRRVLGTFLGVALSLLVAGTALASSCLNVSRAPAAAGSTGPVVRGNWIWLPSVGAPVQAWAFAPPGTPASVGFGFPGANGNYTNGFTSSLLGRSAYCLKGINVTRSHGIVSGCE